MSPAKSRKPRLALVGSDTLKGKEITSVLNARKFPLASFEFYDPDVEQEYSKLGQFRDEPKVIHGLSPAALDGLDLVFLAADVKTNLRYGGLAAEIPAPTVVLTMLAVSARTPMARTRAVSETAGAAIVRRLAGDARRSLPEKGSGTSSAGRGARPRFGSRAGLNGLGRAGQRATGATPLALAMTGASTSGRSGRPISCSS